MTWTLLKTVGHVSSTGSMFFIPIALLRDSWPASYKRGCATKRIADNKAPDSCMAVIQAWPSFWKRLALGAGSYAFVLWMSTNQPETRMSISMMAHLVPDRIPCGRSQPCSERPIVSFPEVGWPHPPTNVTVQWIEKLGAIDLQLAFQMLRRP